MPEAQWFDSDRKGMRQTQEGKPKEFVIYELVQNAWDENTTKVAVSLSRIPNTRKVTLRVEDDNPTGFADLTHAYTLFAPSDKKKNPEKRGKWNFGEKRVLALCDSAEIRSTTGTIIFNQSGRSKSRAKTESGSVFVGVLNMTNDELEQCHQAAKKLLPPANIKTIYNGEEIPTRKELANFFATLATEVADEEGTLRATKRKTIVEIYEPLAGEVPTLYEMGIPVVGTGDRWHINVLQKVPLNIDRDNVTPAYLAYIRATVLEHMQKNITAEDANSGWVKDAIERYGEELSDETITNIVDLKFGPKRVSYDPSDPEANSLATSQGYTVVHGKSLSKDEWNVIRRAHAILPAGQVTPSPKPYSPDGKPLIEYPLEKWSVNMHRVVKYAKEIGRMLLGETIDVLVTNDSNWPFNATYGASRRLTLNYEALGERWFSGPLADINDLLIHEWGHHYASNHLSAEYYKALTKLGGHLSVLALIHPELFKEVLDSNRMSASEKETATV